jgi:hypothetical protein
MSIPQSAVAGEGRVLASADLSGGGVPVECSQALEEILRYARHEPHDAMPALIAWWRLLAPVAPAARGALLERLRRLVRRGAATPRAFLPAALGDTDATLVVAATAGYLGAGPVSLEWRARAVEDALDWIRRGLALNGGAVFVALLRLQDEDLHARLAGWRGRLSVSQRETVWSCCSGDPCPATQQFLADWRAESTG